MRGGRDGLSHVEVVIVEGRLTRGAVGSTLDNVAVRTNVDKLQLDATDVRLRFNTPTAYFSSP